jgi:hypothetical protein
VKYLLCILISFSTAAFSWARLANPYPIAFLRQGDIYLIEGTDTVHRLTELGDVREICWLDGETICFSREMDTGLVEMEDWTGYSKIRDLFLITPKDGSIRQFTADHFARSPAPSTMPGRALFWRDNRALGTVSEIWETIHPLRRNRPLGIRGINPDSAPDQRWTAAQLGDGEPEGIGLYRYPTNDSYRKLRGPYFRPRFSPDSRLLTYISEESGKPEIWGYEIPDGEPRRRLGVGEKIRSIVDFGWAKDGSGYILVLENQEGKSDVYYWEIEQQRLTKLTRTGDIKYATSWH